MNTFRDVESPIATSWKPSPSTSPICSTATPNAAAVPVKVTAGVSGPKVAPPRNRYAAFPPAVPARTSENPSPFRSPAALIEKPSASFADEPDTSVVTLKCAAQQWLLRQSQVPGSLVRIELVVPVRSTALTAK